jgi:sulfite reductase beta subunit-like hemoprotein
VRTLDRSRPFGTVSGQAAHRYEQDGHSFDARGICMDEGGYKPPADAPAPGREVRTTPGADPTVIEQIERQTQPGTEIVVGKQDAPGTTEQTTELATLGLAPKAVSALRGSEIDSVEALCRCTEEQLVALPNIGSGTVKAIKAALKKAHRKLA